MVNVFITNDKKGGGKGKKGSGTGGEVARKVVAREVG